MRRRLAALAFLIAGACAASVPVLDLPPSPVPASAAARSEPRPPGRGSYDSVRSHWIVLRIRGPKSEVELKGWCREGVWTTLEAVRYESFTVRETWGRLGERKPRRLGRVVDQARAGTVARLRPEADGGISLHVETAQVEAGRPLKVGSFQKQAIMMRGPVRYGYRFSTRLPRRSGAVAAWQPGVQVVLREQAPLGADRGEARGAVTFRFGEGSGFVAGAPAQVESFYEEWRGVEPVLEDADGVLFGDFRMQRERRASGFLVDAQGRPTAFDGSGLKFEFGRTKRSE